MRPLSVLFLLATAMTAAGADAWPQFRGPSGGRADNAQLADEWSADKNVAWMASLPGSGWASPIVWGDKVFLSTAVGAKGTKAAGFSEGVRGLNGLGGGSKPLDEEFTFEVHCLDRATGKSLWKFEAARQKPLLPIHVSNSFATETPCTDGERVYAAFGTIGLIVCCDLAGKEVWRKDVGVFKMTSGLGAGSSPAIADGRLFVQRDNEEKSFLLALDARTGKELWKADRESKTGWSTPFIWKTKDRTELVVCGSGKVVSHDPATGKVLWTLGVSSSFAPSPTATEDFIVFGCSSPFTTGQTFCIRAGAAGDITLPRGQKSGEFVAWSLTGTSPGMSSPVIVDGRVYVMNNFLMCLDLKTGEQLYRERLPNAKSVAASLLAANGRVFVTDEDGQTFVIEAGPKFKLLATNSLEGLFWSSPAAVGGELFLRAADRLYCIRK